MIEGYGAWIPVRTASGSQYLRSYPMISFCLNLVRVHVPAAEAANAGPRVHYRARYTRFHERFARSW